MASILRLCGHSSYGTGSQFSRGSKSLVTKPKKLVTFAISCNAVVTIKEIFGLYCKYFKLGTNKIINFECNTAVLIFL